MYQRFVELLQEHDISAGRVAAATGISRTTLTDWKNGRSVPKLDKMTKIAEYFNVSLDYLLGAKTKKDPLAGEGEKVSSELIALLQDLDPAEEALVRDYVLLLKRSRKD